MRRRFRLRLGILFLLLWGCCSYASAQKVWLKTNALYWAATHPNLGLEWRVSRHFSMNIEAAGTYWNISDHAMRSAAIMPEVRYWFAGRPQIGHFVGVMGMAANYRLQWNDEWHNGDALAFGPTYGYSFALSSRWAMETTIGLGLLYAREKKCNLSEGIPPTVNNKKWMVAPIKLGVTFSYILK